MVLSSAYYGSAPAVYKEFKRGLQRKEIAMEMSPINPCAYCGQYVSHKDEQYCAGRKYHIDCLDFLNKPEEVNDEEKESDRKGVPCKNCGEKKEVFIKPGEIVCDKCGELKYQESKDKYP